MAIGSGWPNFNSKTNIQYLVVYFLGLAWIVVNQYFLNCKSTGGSHSVFYSHLPLFFSRFNILQTFEFDSYGHNPILANLSANNY